MNKVIRPVGVFHEPLMDVLVYETKYQLGYAFARFQEFYENDVLAGTLFTRQQLQDLQPEYYVTWSGYNLPPYIVREFKENGAKWKLDPHEQAALDCMQLGHYIAGCFVNDMMAGTIRHERAHAAWNLDQVYHVGCRDIMHDNDGEIRVKAGAAIQLMGYSHKVIDDEIQAYTCHGWEKLKLDVGPIPGLREFQKKHFEHAWGVFI